MIWWIIIFLILALLAFLVSAPIVLEFNSERHRYRLSIGGIFSASGVLIDGIPFLRLRIFGWPIDIDLTKRRPSKPKPAVEVPKPRKSRRLSAGDLLRKLRQVPRAFELREFEADIDTGDFALNALLAPVGYFVSGRAGTLRFNFQGIVTLRMRLVTSGGRIAAALLT